MTITGTVGNFVRGEIITGGTTGAKARIITVSSPMEYVLTDGVGATDFNSGEVITGSSSAATATVGTVTAGSKIITSNYVLDTGQRDNFYDISRIIRKVGVSPPRGRLLIVFDFFGHGAGEFFSVDHIQMLLDKWVMVTFHLILRQELTQMNQNQLPCSH